MRVVELPTIRVLVAGDNVLAKAGIRKLLEENSLFEIAAEASGGREAVTIARKILPDLVLLDGDMTDVPCLEVIQQVKTVSPKSKIIISTVHDDQFHVKIAFRFGADGYVLKNATEEEDRLALQRVVAGNRYLSVEIASFAIDTLATSDVSDSSQERGIPFSKREREVLMLIAEGLTSKEIAPALSVSVKTVSRYRASLMHKLGLHSAAQLIKYAIDNSISP